MQYVNYIETLHIVAHIAFSRFVMQLILKELLNTIKQNFEPRIM